MLLHCTVCDFTTPAWSRDALGRPVNGHLALRAHVAAEHPAQLRRIRQSFGEGARRGE